jgi:hypothetical protein
VEANRTIDTILLRLRPQRNHLSSFALFADRYLRPKTTCKHSIDNQLTSGGNQP